MQPNDVPESIIGLLAEVADRPYLRNYEVLKRTMGPACKITMKAAEIFIEEHMAQLEQIGRALHELGIGEEIHGRLGRGPTTRSPGESTAESRRDKGESATITPNGV